MGCCCAGQSNDGIFKFARAGQVTCKVDKIKEVLENSIVLSSGEHVPADVVVFAYGLKYQAEPECLKELGTGNFHLSVLYHACKAEPVQALGCPAKSMCLLRFLVFGQGLKKKEGERLPKKDRCL